MELLAINEKINSSTLSKQHKSYSSPDDNDGVNKEGNALQDY